MCAQGLHYAKVPHANNISIQEARKIILGSQVVAHLESEHLGGMRQENHGLSFFFKAACAT